MSSSLAPQDMPFKISIVAALYPRELWAVHHVSCH